MKKIFFICALLMFSGSTFALCNVDITYPTGGEYISGTMNVTWSATEDFFGDCTGVDVTFEYNDGGTVGSIGGPTPAIDGTAALDSNTYADTSGGYIAIIPNDGGTSGVNASPFIVDNTAPSITTVSIASDNPNNTSLAKVGDTITLDFISDEDLTNTPTVFIAGGMASVVGGGTIWSATYTVTGVEGQGAVSITIDGEDLAGNSAPQTTDTTDSSEVIVDTIAPTITEITAVAASTGGYSADNTPQWTLQSDEDGNLGIDNGCSAQILSGVSAGVDKTISLDSDGMGGALADGTYTTCRALVVDAAGNESTYLTISAFTIDTAAPTLSNVSISSDNTDTTRAKQGDTITVSFSSDEDMMDSPSVTIAGKTAIVGGGPTNWTASYTLTNSETEGAVAITIDGYDLTEVNALTQVTSTTDASSVTIDITKPILTAVSIGSDNTDSAYAKSADTITLSFESDEDILGTPTVTIASKSATVTGGPTIFEATWTVDGTETQGAAAITIDASDLAGNTLTQVTNTTDASSVTIDYAQPTLQSFTTTTLDDTYGPGSNIYITANYDEDILSGGTLTVDLNNGVTGIGLSCLGATTSCEGTYTVGSTGSGEDIDDLDVSAITSESVSDSSANIRSDSSVPATNISDATTINIDTTAPILPLVTIISNNSANTSEALQGSTVSLSFDSNEPVVSTPSMSLLGASSNPLSSCDPVYDTSTGARTSWQYDCLVGTVDDEGFVMFTIDFLDDYGNIGTTVTTTTDASQMKIKLYGSGGGGGGGGGGTVIKSNNSSSGSQTNASEDKDEEKTQSSTQATQQDKDEKKETNTKLPQIEVDEPVCTSQTVKVCERKGTDLDIMSYQRHLACAGVVAPAQTCEDAHCDRWAKRKEVVAISVALGNHNLQTPDKYRHPYSDIDYDDGGWLPPVVETSFGLGITGAKPEFRPEREVTRAEAYGMMMKSVCMPLENDTTDWMYNIFLTAQKYKITSRSNQDFHGENSVSRQELFVVGSRLLDYVNETGGCYAKVVCEE